MPRRHGIMLSIPKILLFFLSSVVSQQDTSEKTPLASKRFPWPNIPYKADTGTGARGVQSGYNICNATTQSQASECQTAWLDSIEGFCLWGASKPNSVVGDVEGEMVAYCTQKKYGARMIPAGAIQGLQLTRAPSYIQLVGFIDQTALNIKQDDQGGEMDPHGADLRGNPLGALVYSTAFGANPGTKPTQVIEWTFFAGSDVFCFKACDPASPDGPRLCEHIYDRSGCEYNMPADYKTIKGTFTACKSENQLPVGVYVEQGVTKTWKQPSDEAANLTQIPYKPWIPPTSDCKSFDPSALWPELVPGILTQNTTSNPKDGLPLAQNTMQNAAARSEGVSILPRTMFLGFTIVASCFGIAFSLVF